VWRFTPEGPAGTPALPATATPAKVTPRLNSFTYEDPAKRDKFNLDTFWLQDDALTQFAAIAEDLN